MRSISISKKFVLKLQKKSRLMISKLLKKCNSFHGLSSIADNILMFVDRVFVVSSYILRKNFDFSSGSYTLKLWDN